MAIRLLMCYGLWEMIIYDKTRVSDNQSRTILWFQLINSICRVTDVTLAKYRGPFIVYTACYEWYLDKNIPYNANRLW